MIPSEVTVKRDGSRIRFEIDGIHTDWMDEDDSFIERIDESSLNRVFLRRHILKEIEIRNLLDEGIGFLKSEECSKAIDCFDEVLFYDFQYGEALLNKSHALFCQKHFIKALRNYMKAIEASSDLEDGEYRKLLLKMSDDEKDNLPEIKQHICAGDEHFESGEYEKALKNYENALAIPSQVKEKILFKLLNKKGTTHLKLNDFESGLACFNESLNQLNNDYAWYGRGQCEYGLGLDASDSMTHAVNLDKGQLLEKAIILNEQKHYNQALETCDVILDNHFRVDDFYFRALNAKMYAMRELDMDLGEIEKIFEALEG
ncbi:MAG: hypothetical protein E7Z77_00885 [Methanobrevibacter sp.]|uniref:tetratricopeptide repeat protein n=1 Tax=Methanobrevibacter sp. TaxID=66852 RepID=UPI0025ECC349|nr:hypothetical protein [Methanobrevibacter sp.]MBE6507946.1 hypothetical protein [Methanobrevibacter sp.]